VELGLQLVTNRFKCSAERSAFWPPVSHLLGLVSQVDVFVAAKIGSVQMTVACGRSCPNRGRAHATNYQHARARLHPCQKARLHESFMSASTVKAYKPYSSVALRRYQDAQICVCFCQLC
jgi:hypothetical protein